ncbi:MAG: methyltransferase [Pseudomonadota bacterium]
MTDPKNLETYPVPTVDDSGIYDFAMSIFAGQAALVAFDLGLFELLAEGPETLLAVSERLGLAPRSAEAILDVCVALKLLSREGDHFALTELTRAHLLPESQTYLGDFLRAATFGQPELTSFPSVRRAIVENRAQVYDGKEMFETHAQVDARAREFTLMMHGHSIGSALAWPTRTDLADVGHMVDVGGGSGAHAIGAALRWPHLTAEVADMAAVVPVAEEMIAKYGVTDRVRASALDFWGEALPPSDLHFYGDIFHDWPDEKCLGLMQKSFDALPPGGRIMVHEVLKNEDRSGPLLAAALSVVMLAWTEGKQRTGAEYKAMLESVGFAEVEVWQAFGYWSIVSARKPQ